MAKFSTSTKLPLITRLALLPALLAISIVLGTVVGSTAIPPAETLRILLYKVGMYGGHVNWSIQDQDIVWLIRLPRVAAAALVGGALGVAGALFQAVLRNPLADPYVIGTSAGAGLGVALALVWSVGFSVLGFGSIQVMAFMGALGTVLFVYGLARSGGTTPVVTLLLAGFVTSSFLISATSFLMLASNRQMQVLIWTMGSMDVSEMSQLTIVGPLLVLVVCVAFLLAPRLDVLQLGEEQATHLGVRVESLKLGVIVLASFLTALAVSLAGIVAFVGLVVPHTMRMVYGPSHRVLIPASAVGGAAFLVLADVVAHVALSPTVIPLGAVTAVIGAPFFLHLLRRTRRGYAL